MKRHASGKRKVRIRWKRLLMISLLVATMMETPLFHAQLSEQGVETTTPPSVCDVAVQNRESKRVIQDAEERTVATEPPVPVLSQPAEDAVETEVSTVSVSMENTLFIGDSRTVGLAEYALLEGAHFFATTGMTVYGVEDITLSVPDVGKVTLEELLYHRRYDRIYLMLGINELGYPFAMTVNKYKALVAFLRESQPDALLVLEANLHIRKSRSDTDKFINNPQIDRLNAEIAGLADGEHIFYLDANEIFDDATGALAEEKSGDAAHPTASGYQEWGCWLKEQTRQILSE